MIKLTRSAFKFRAACVRGAAWCGAALVFASLTACTNVLPPKALSHSPQFEPVYPVPTARDTMATGAIYVGRQSDSWFGKSKSFQVGDVITVLLNESRNKPLNSELGENDDTFESVEGSSSLATNIPPSNRNTRYKPFCAARFTSARSRPASVKPMPAKQAVPKIRNSNICSKLI